MHQLLVVIFTLFISVHDAKGLVQTAKDTRLTQEKATKHLAAARVAAQLTDTDPELLLAIAYHESRYKPSLSGPLVRKKRACGIMQPTPIASPCREESLLHEYLEGARHLRTWLNATHGNVKHALLGYAGGYKLLRRCAGENKPRACGIVKVHLARANRIKQALKN